MYTKIKIHTNVILQRQQNRQPNLTVTHKYIKT